MDEEQVEFRAGRDSFGQALWVAGLIVDREWVRDADVRHATRQTH